MTQCEGIITLEDVKKESIPDENIIVSTKEFGDIQTHLYTEFFSESEQYKVAGYELDVPEELVDVCKVSIVVDKLQQSPASSLNCLQGFLNIRNLFIPVAVCFWCSGIMITF